MKETFLQTSELEDATIDIQFSSVQLLSRVRLCDSMDCSTPGLPFPHQLPESTQTHVHRVSDATQPAHPLSSLFLLPSIFPNIRAFSNESVLCIVWPKYCISASTSVLSMNTQYWSPLRWTGWISLQSKGISRVFSVAANGNTVFLFMALSGTLLYVYLYPLYPFIYWRTHVVSLS